MSSTTVSRTADDLTRYHGKMLIIDGRLLFVLGFNFTTLDTARSRSFALAIEDPGLVEDALRLFEADAARQPYEPRDPRLVVSPINARQRLGQFLIAAKRELLIYDLNLADAAIARILEDRAKAGVSIRVIGASTRLSYRKSAQRLHARAIVRDGESLFLGSQSLRTAELEKRRKIGVLVHDATIATMVQEVFEKDWKAAEPAGTTTIDLPAMSVAKKVAKAVTREMPPMTHVLTEALKEVTGSEVLLHLDPEEFQSSVKSAVKQVVRQTVEEQTPA